MKNILILIALAYVGESFAVCDTPISRTNFSTLQVLTSTRLNTELNTIYTQVNELPGDCLLDESVTSAKIDDGTIVNADISASASIARSKLSSVNYVVSSSSGAFGTVSTTLVDVTNLSGTIVTTGGPVEISLITIPSTDPDADAGYIGGWTTEGTAEPRVLALLKGGVVLTSSYYLAEILVSDDIMVSSPCSSFRYVDFPAAGSHTYKIQAKTTATANFAINKCRLLVREL